MLTLAPVAALGLMVMLLSSTSARPLALMLATSGFIVFRGTPLPGGWPAVLFLLVALFVVRPRGLERPKYPNYFGTLAWLLAAIAAIALLWSPTPAVVVIALAGWGSLAVAIALARVSLPHPNHIRALAIGIMLPMLALAATVVVFRFWPDIERDYYTSGIARLFLGSSGGDLYSSNVLLSNNAAELDRAAGFMFVNVNRASMVLGVSALVLFGVARHYGLRGLKWAAVMIAAAVPLTGSKTGTVMLATVCVLFVVAWISKSQKDDLLKAVVNLGAMVAIFFAVRTVVTSESEFIANSQATLKPREALWSEAIRAIEGAPTLGLGFGGWEERWRSGAVLVPFNDAIRPVHNWFLQAWLDGGLLYIAVHVVLAVSILVACLTSYRRATTGSGVALLAFALAPAWALIHGLGDNTPLYGDLAVVFPLGLAFAFLMQAKHEPAPGQVTASEDRESAASPSAR